MDTIIASAPVGSELYGLQAPSSDKDVLRITDSMSYYSQQAIRGEDDVRTVSLGFFLDKIYDSQPVEVDVLRSPTFSVLNENYYPLLSSIRFNPFVYVKRAESHSLQCFSRKEYGADTRRGIKNLKCGLRTLIVAQKVLEYGQHYSPVIDRNAFYSTLDRFILQCELLKELPVSERGRVTLNYAVSLIREDSLLIA